MGVYFGIRRGIPVYRYYLAGLLYVWYEQNLNSKGKRLARVLLDRRIVELLLEIETRYNHEYP